MAVKVLINQAGQHIIADTKQVTRKDDDELVAYWVSNPRLVTYRASEESDSGIAINFMQYCLVSDEAEFSIKADNIVAILEPRDDVLTSYTQRVFPQKIDDELSAGAPEDGADTDDSNGPDAGGTESSPVSTDDSVGQDEAVAESVA